LIATIPLERRLQHAYAARTGARIWELGPSAHTNASVTTQANTPDE
jgi:hypothetical protein